MNGNMAGSIAVVATLMITPVVAPGAVQLEASRPEALQGC